MAGTQEWRQQRLKALADKYGGNAELGRAMGYRDGAYVGQMIGGLRPISEKTIDRAHNLPGCGGWFTQGRAGTLTLVADNEAPQQEMFGDGINIAVLSAAGSMGPGAEQHDDVVIGRITVSPQWAAKTLTPLTKMENLRFIHGYGDSMEPTYSDGDILLVDVGVRNCDVDGIYVLEANDRLFIKRVTERFDGVHEITSDNPKVKTVQALDGSQPVDVLGRVIWAWNGKKL
jgi:hypothetical protein